ncbi:preprotein translocase subunit YajC [Sphingomonas oligophenolica]|uniref:Sec translocon accessory complex subunit YajC n=1 Tax=Sphingomonas oligophenolica TaxID=301154 RepID=A0ABU9XZQ6_9SPHN
MFATIALAAATAGTAPGAGLSATLNFFLPMIAVAFVGYFLLWRPQNQRMKAHQARIDSVKKGDSVVTAGGIAGKVTKVDDRFVEVEIAPTVKVRVVKSTLAEVTAPGTTKPAND